MLVKAGQSYKLSDCASMVFIEAGRLYKLGDRVSTLFVKNSPSISIIHYTFLKIILYSPFLSNFAAFKILIYGVLVLKAPKD
jgi:hypothetical protein